MQFLRIHTANVEVFSIDEAFVELTGLGDMYSTDYAGVASKLQKQILQEVGIPVSIGVANTRIKAKIFSKIRKPYGIFAPLDVSQEDDTFQTLSF